MEDLRVLLFLHIVVAILMSITGLRLFGYKGELKTFIYIGIIQGTFVWLIRGLYYYFNIPLGTHTLILMLSLFILIKLFTRVNWGIAFGSSLVSFSLAMIGGGLPGLVMNYFNLNVNDIISNTWLHILIGYSETIFMIILLVINSITGFTLTHSYENTSSD